MVFKNKTYPDNTSLKKAHLDYPDVMPNGWQYYGMIENKLMAILNEIPRKSKLLDIGCNSGEISLMLKQLSRCRPYGIDIAEKMLPRAKRKGIKVACSDAEYMPFKDNSFDCVFLGEMIEHNYNPGGILRECKRVLKDQGVLVGTTVDEYTLLKVGGYKWEDVRLHAKPYSLSIMRRLLKRYFKTVKVYDIFTRNEYGSGVPWIIFKGRKNA